MLQDYINSVLGCRDHWPIVWILPNVWISRKPCLLWTNYAAHRCLRYRRTDAVDQIFVLVPKTISQSFQAQHQSKEDKQIIQKTTKGTSSLLASALQTLKHSCLNSSRIRSFSWCSCSRSSNESFGLRFGGGSIGASPRGWLETEATEAE